MIISEVVIVPEVGIAPEVVIVPEVVIIPDVVITGLDPVIRLLRRNLLRRSMDARIKSGHDECVLWGER